MLAPYIPILQMSKHLIFNPFSPSLILGNLQRGASPALPSRPHPWAHRLPSS